MQYEAIDACPNDHIIYYKQHEFEKKIPKCHISRYHTYQQTKKVPRKVLRYIPIIPRLQRLFRCKNISQFMDYYATKIIQNYIILMLTDGSTVRDMEKKWPHFKEEPRNLRISFAVDGVNPFS